MSRLIITPGDVITNSVMVNQLYALRQRLVQQFLDPPNRNINVECGYPDHVSVELMRQAYEREGLASRIISLYPFATWEYDPEVYEDEDPAIETEFEEAWTDLEEEFNINHYLARIDEMSGIGHYGVLLIGIDDGKRLSEPVDGIGEDGKLIGTSTPPERHLTYLRCFDETLCQIDTYETDETNPRYGQPVMYQLKFHDPKIQILEGTTQPMDIKQVHWTRVLHIADNCKSSEVFGTPRLVRSYNRIYDLRKILSGSGEMFWKGAFPGLSFELDPALFDKGFDFDKEEVRKEFAKYQDGLQRYIATIGLRVKPLALQVASPIDHMTAQLQAIAIIENCPMRVLMGSERGELASSQDTEAWNSRVGRRNRKYAIPRIVRPMAKRLQLMGVLPPTKDDKFKVEFPDRNAPDDNTKAQTALVITQAMQAYVQAGVETLMPPMEFLTKVFDYTQEEAEAIIEAADKLNEEQEAHDMELAAEQQKMGLLPPPPVPGAPSNGANPAQPAGAAKPATAKKVPSKKPPTKK